ncbi:MAG: lysophospholipid acyltransferase family protein [Acidobacteriota bacterium]
MTGSPTPTSVSSWRASRAKRLEARLIAAVGYRLMAWLGSTLRWRTEGLEQFDRIVAGGQQPIMAFWHGRILPATYYFRRRGIVVITSENFDGEWIAGIIERFGFRTARGSTSRGARRALLQLRRDMAAGQPAGFTVDGPRGPARVAQPGAVWLAKVTGNPVLPFHLEAARHWTLRSWDRTQIPRPFTTVSIAMGEPFLVAADADDAGVEMARRSLETRLEALEQRALALVHGQGTRAETS